MNGIASDWAGLLDQLDVLIIDVETTGLGDFAEVVEIALLDTAGRVVYDAPIMPQGRIPKGASDIHGLTRKRLKELGARPWPEHQTAIVEALRGVSMLLAYNLDFDARMVNQTIERYGIPFASFASKSRCLMLDYAEWRGIPHKWRKGEYRWHKLADAYRRECKRIGQQHRALDDCRMSLDLMRVVASKGDALAPKARRDIGGSGCSDAARRTVSDDLAARRTVSDDLTAADYGCLATAAVVLFIVIAMAC